MASLRSVNENAEVASKSMALGINVAAAKGLSGVLKTNLGPRGTLKLLVGGAGQLKLTKDGKVLLHEMQIQHPTASLIARAATAQDDITGDGTTSTVLFVGEMIRQAERHLLEGTHPRILTDGFDIGKEEALKFLDSFKLPKSNILDDRELLTSVARTALKTKLPSEVAEDLTEDIVEAILTIKRENEPLDLFMVEIQTMMHKSVGDSRLVKGLVLDHGARHPDMPKSVKNARVLTCNVSLEYEKSEVSAGFYYKNAEEREKMVESERKFTDEKVRKIIEFKRRVCKEDEGFVVINQKGIDPLSLDMLAKEGILGIRRAKRRNMERLTLACGGIPVNSVEDLSEESLGFAGHVYEQTLGEEKYTFVEDVKNPRSCTLLIRGSNKYLIEQMKDAIRDGLRAVKNAVEDESVVPGAGAYEIAAYEHLMEFKKGVKGKRRLGVEAFAEALLIIPKTLAANSGFDIQDSIVKLEDERKESGQAVGLDITTGDPMLPELEGVFDNARVKRQCLHLCTSLATQLLLVDEVLKAGKQMGKAAPGPEMGMGM